MLELARRAGEAGYSPAAGGPLVTRLGLSLLGMVVLGVGCLGDRGPPGPSGDAGPPGPGGDAGPNACARIDGGTPGIDAVALSLSSPINGAFFTAGEQPVVTVQVTGARCGILLPATDLGTANLYVAGPRRTLDVRTASQLLNAV